MRLGLRCYALWLLLAAQIIFTFYYILVTAPFTREPTTSVRSWSAISFVQQAEVSSRHNRPSSDYLATPVYLSNLQLDRRKYFRKLNTSECFTPGTDIRFSNRFSRCQCIPGWHGIDCGLPEVMWRAFIAARHKDSPQRREIPRRIVSCIVSKTASILTEIFVQELSNVVDLFIIANIHVNQSLEIPKYIKNKILIVNLNINEEFSWLDTRKLIPDLKYDDLILFMSDEQIPNPRALLFFKLYDGWPQPIAFRLRWSVYGFFWQHPKRTTLGGAASTAGVLAKQYLDNYNKIRTSAITQLMVGDLNHFGGWQCSWCLQSPQDIIKKLQVVKPTDWDVSGHKVDTSYIEELIGNGLWVDGKTQLLRTSQSRDNYFAPTCVLNNSEKYDFLLQNIYLNLDY